MLRLAVLLAALLLAPAAIAGAHTCGTVGWLEPGRSGSVTLGVAAEASPVVGVTVSIPAGFRLDGVDAPSGWRYRIDAGSVELAGGPLRSYTCGFFFLKGSAEGTATLVFPYSVRSADGVAREFASHDRFDAAPAKIVYVGDADASMPATEPHDGGRSDVASVAALLGGVGVAVWLLRLRRRARSPRRART